MTFNDDERKIVKTFCGLSPKGFKEENIPFLKTAKSEDSYKLIKEVCSLYGIDWEDYFIEKKQKRNESSFVAK